MDFKMIVCQDMYGKEKLLPTEKLVFRPSAYAMGRLREQQTSNQ